MSNDAPIIQGRVETRRTSDGRSITTVTDGQGWHLVYDDDGKQAYTVDPSGNRTATIRAAENGRLQLPQDAVSKELRNSLEPEGMMTGDENWKRSAFSALGNLFSVIRTVSVGRNIEMRQGDLQSLSRAMQERQREQESGKEQPAPAMPHGSIEQLGDHFRAEAPASIKAEVRAEGGLKDSAPAPASVSHTSLPANQSGDDFAAEIASFSSALPSSRRVIVADASPEPQLDHGLGGTGAKRQASPETFRA